MNLAGIYLSDSLTTAIGWTIVHSLWQGTAIGLIAFLILKIRKTAPAQLRYLIGVLSLGAILVASITTFVFEYKPITGIPGSTVDPDTIVRLGNIFRISSGVSNGSSYMHFIQQTTLSLFPWMISIWLFGVILLSLRLAGGLILVERLRTRNVSLLPAALENRLMALAVRSGITRLLQVLQSGEVKVPTVIGVFRPVILIPAGMISLMPIEQLESIFVHEIAHIRRFDFLINILQSLLEALFFYHPVVWILSAGLRQEREKCCDDFAVSIGGNLSIYAKALMGLSEIQSGQPLPSVALTGNKNRIILRVERLINSKKMKTNASEKIFAGILILVSAIILTLSTGAKMSPQKNLSGSSTESNQQDFNNKQDELVSEESELSLNTVLHAVPSLPVSVADHALPELPVAPDTCSTSLKMDVKDNIVTRDFVNKEGKETTIRYVIRKGEVEQLFVNGEEIPESEFPEYQKEIDRTMKDLNEMDRDLREAREEIRNIDWDEIHKEVQAGVEEIKHLELEDLHREMEMLHQEHMQIQIDHKMIQEEMARAMEEGLLEREKMIRTMEEELKAVREIDFKEMQEEIELAMKDIEAINLEEIQFELQESLKDLKIEQLQMDREMRNLDELIEELEKLELQEQ